MFSIPDHIPIDDIVCPVIETQGVKLSMLRLDSLHPEVSGNKIYKLHYYIEECMNSHHKTLVTFGGAFSNHLAATAFLCREKGIKAIGVVRGEEPAMLSHTLKNCRAQGMRLRFISRDEYKRTGDEDFPKILKKLYGDCTIVPEGGFGAAGAKGASLIMDLICPKDSQYICTSVGTATTLGGLMLKKNNRQEIVAVPALKNMQDINARIAQLTGTKEYLPAVFGEYHFGGYAKYNDELLGFINDFYRAHHIPLDFVYTGKLMYAVMDQIKKGYFKNGSHIVCVHTGGLQGNRSLAAGTFIFE